MARCVASHGCLPDCEVLEFRIERDWEQVNPDWVKITRICTEGMQGVSEEEKEAMCNYARVIGRFDEPQMDNLKRQFIHNVPLQWW